MTTHYKLIIERIQKDGSVKEEVYNDITDFNIVNEKFLWFDQEFVWEGETYKKNKMWIRIEEIKNFKGEEIRTFKDKAEAEKFKEAIK